MLIETSPSIAYKCSSCGTYAFFKLSIFKLLNMKQHIFSCQCQKTKLLINKESDSLHSFKIRCIGCGEVHKYIINRKDLLLKDINVFCCPETDMQLCFVGKDGKVSEKVDNVEKEMDKIIDEFGYESYFENTQVMLDSLNKIHDIAEQKKLCCECGNDDIELLLLSDRIYLRCSQCSADKIIYAATNEELRDTLRRQQIFLTNHFKTGKERKDIFIGDVPVPKRNLLE